MLKLPLLLPFMGVSLFWSGIVHSSEIQPLRLVSASDPVAAPERMRPLDTVTSGERDLNVEVSRSALLEAEGAPIDFERIEGIKAAIEAGSYRLRPDLIADAMIASYKPAGDAA